MKTFFKLIILSAFVFGCSAKSISTMPDQQIPGLANTPVVRKSLFASQGPISDDVVKKILNSKIVIPKKSRIVVIRLDSAQLYQDGWQNWRAGQDGSETFQLSEQIVNDFDGALRKSPYVSKFSILPGFLLGNETNVETIRTAALRTQADFALVIKSESFLDWKYRGFFPNQAKSIGTVEAILLDTRTGIIPFSAIVSETHTEEAKDDLSNQELMLRTRLISEGKALKELASGVLAFLDSSEKVK